MCKKLLYSVIIIAAVVSIPLSATAQNITVTAATGQNIGTFVATNLLGEGVYVSNVKFNNAPGNITKAQIGTFNANGFPHLMMSNGVVMTTGNVSVAAGPNSSGSSSSAISGYYSDPQMSSVASGSVTACSVLDFDFVSVSPFINVNYCFGSEEYPEYVCSSFNDVFAFFITGPDPQTGETRTWNMARIPHTVSTTNPDGIAVAINSVNPGSAGGSGGGSGCYYNYTEYYVANTYSTGVQYDGFTQKLSASATILPCETYHMHISICNVGDNAYDSGVFLEANSFNSPQAQVNFAPATIDTVYRSHPHAVPLTLIGTDYNYGLMRIAFGGTAINGQDYYCYTDEGDTLTQYHNFIYLSPDTTHYLYIVGTPGANLAEPKTITMNMNTSLCENNSDLKGYDTLRCILAEDDIVRLRDTVITAVDECTEVGVSVAFSRHPLSFQWMPEDDIFFPTQQYSTASITESRVYHVRAYDELGNADTAEVNVVVSYTPEGVDDVELNEVNLYPNPADGILNVVANGLRKVEIFSATGALVHTAECDGHIYSVDTESFTTGIYTVRVTTDTGSTVGKVAVR